MPALRPSDVCEEILLRRKRDHRNGDLRKWGITPPLEGIRVVDALKKNKSLAKLQEELMKKQVSEQ
jgi:hypothetical protein